MNANSNIGAERGEEPEAAQQGSGKAPRPAHKRVHGSLPGGIPGASKGDQSEDGPGDVGRGADRIGEGSGAAGDTFYAELARCVIGVPRLGFESAASIGT